MFTDPVALPAIQEACPRLNIVFDPQDWDDPKDKVFSELNLPHGLAFNPRTPPFTVGLTPRLRLQGSTCNDIWYVLRRSLDAFLVIPSFAPSLPRVEETNAVITPVPIDR